MSGGAIMGSIFLIRQAINCYCCSSLFTPPLLLHASGQLGQLCSCKLSMLCTMVTMNSSLLFPLHEEAFREHIIAENK
jgi:hypothetical protein